MSKKGWSKSHGVGSGIFCTCYSLSWVLGAVVVVLGIITVTVSHAGFVCGGCQGPMVDCPVVSVVTFRAFGLMGRASMLELVDEIVFYGHWVVRGIAVLGVSVPELS